MRYLTTEKTPKNTAKKLRGLVLYRGPSMLDGAPIAMVATLSSDNKKTGNMIQTWIIRGDINPVAASQAGLDSSICGNCPHRHYKGTTGKSGACYVNIGQAPGAVYRGLERGIYPDFNFDDHAQYFTGRKIRLGAYGDPAAVPFGILKAITDISLGHTGYTHQIEHKKFDSRILTLCQVSADSPNQAKKYQALGGKTFRVAMAGDALFDNEIECLSDSKGINCADCLLCDGTTKNIAITIHGSRAGNFKTSLIKAINI